MELRNQVSTFEQSKKLKQLGIIQNSSCFYWHFGVISETWILINAKDSCVTVNEYSAFTVAELGIMLPAWYFTYNQTGGTFHVFTVDKGEFSVIKGLKPTYNNEAEGRAAMLIYLIENNSITSVEVNEKICQE